MNLYKADLHIHTLLSPCGDLDMTPKNILAKSKAQNIDIIGITDHNSVRQCYLVKELAENDDILVLCGAEVTTSEEVHCLVFFEKDHQLIEFQDFIEENLPGFLNDPSFFGYQVVIDKNEDIIYEEELLLTSALRKSIDEISEKVSQLNGIFIPAHIDKSKNSIISQLGFVPKGLKFDALGLSPHCDFSEFIVENSYLKDFSFVRNSDAHYVDDIGKVFTELKMKELSFEEVRMALNKIDGRKIVKI